MYPVSSDVHLQSWAPPASLLARGTSLAHLSERAWDTFWLAFSWLETGDLTLAYLMDTYSMYPIRSVNPKGGHEIRMSLFLSHYWT